LARRGELSRLWIFKVDRVTRRGAADLLGLVHELRRHGCTLTAVADPLDFEGPIGDIVLAVLGAVAEIELNIQRERRDAARALAESKGVKWGRPTLETDRLEEIALFLELRKQGLTLRKAAKEAGIGYGTAHRLDGGRRQLQSLAVPLPAELPRATNGQHDSEKP
jgi:DNA invertase Pin-like site-specific DNA recombinase